LLFRQALIANNNYPRGELAGSVYDEYYETFKTIDVEGALESIETQKSGALTYNIAFGSATRNRLLCITSCSDYRLLPAFPRPGNKVCVFPGGSVPLLIREDGIGAGNDGVCVLMGSCYVHGLMNGEGLERYKLRTIMLR
jgi:hypothetical protein